MEVKTAIYPSSCVIQTAEGAWHTTAKETELHYLKNTQQNGKVLLQSATF